MKQLQLTITALSPLAMGRQKPGGSVSEVEPYIPGSVLRGAIAGRILQLADSRSPEAGDDFQKLFLGDTPAIFTNAYPTANGSPASVLPATALSCKTNAGFRRAEDPEDVEDVAPHGVFDTLIDRFCATGWGFPFDPTCPRCETGGRVEPFKAFANQHNGQYAIHKADSRLLTRVGIERRRATAAEQILYSTQVLNENTPERPCCFRGAIWVDDDALAEALTHFLQAQAFRLGGGASRGLGKVEIFAECREPQFDVTDCVDAFNTTLRKRWQLWQEVFGAPQQERLAGDRTFFTLDLQAEAILRESWQRTTVLSAEMLQAEAEVDDPDLQLHVAYSSYGYRSGWNAAWGLMKDVELTTERGGVFLFSTPHRDRWLPALERLTRSGVGDRRPEGFGQVGVCHPFHSIFREEAV